jgi:hypothetical protein
MYGRYARWRRAPQMGQMADVPVGSGCISVAQPLVEQNSR